VHLDKCAADRQIRVESGCVCGERGVKENIGFTNAVNTLLIGKNWFRNKVLPLFRHVFGPGSGQDGEWRGRSG